MIKKTKIIDDDENLENENNNINDININTTNKKDEKNNIISRVKIIDQPFKTKFNYMSVFNRNNYNIFDKSQNIPSINKFIKKDL